MNCLYQTESGLLSDKESLEELASKDHARILVLSDSHGNYRIFQKILNQFGPGCDALVFCGDGIGDLAEILEQAKRDKEIKKTIPPVVAFVRGNGDPFTYPVSFDIGKYNKNAAKDPKGTMYVPESQILTANHTNFFITHGHNQGVYFGINNLGLAVNYNRCQVGLYGHTHIGASDTFPDCKLVNPGSCSRPRGGDTASCAIITVEKTFTDVAFIKIQNAFGNSFDFKVI